MNDQDDVSPEAMLSLRHATWDDRVDMLRVMEPFKNGYIPGKLDTRRTLVAVIGDEIVGFVGWEKDQVLALYVAEAWRSRKLVGPILLQAAEDAIRQKGHAGVRIMIDADATRAHRFYVQNGYETHWNRDNEDIAWMRKRFDR